ncbi:MAG TPA: stage II sporulation protein P [Bacillales bacterium]|nr:stage II sporulation protein P [Bacillales bacterium]
MLSNQPSPSSSLSLQKFSLKPLILFIISAVVALFVFSALLTALDEKYHFASSSIKEWTSSISSEAMLEIIGFENPYFTQVLPQGDHIPSVSSLSLKLITSVEPGDIRSLLGGELPGFEIYDSEILVAGAGTDFTNLTIESAPPVGVMMKQRKVATDELKKLNDEEKEKNVAPPAKTTGGKNVVFLYDTHSTESYLPVLKDTSNPDSAYSWKINMSDVMERLGKDLENDGIGTIVTDKNIQKMVQEEDKKYYQSYQVSRQVVTAAMQEDPNLQLFFDIHRDSRSGGITTATINGKKYARVMFVVGKANPNYEKNAQMAKRLHALLQKKYFGLSRGVEAKGTDGGRNNGVYNQDLSSHAILIEIGGVSNTLEEVYRTCDALAEVISDYYWNLQKAQAVSGTAH